MGEVHFHIVTREPVGRPGGDRQWTAALLANCLERLGCRPEPLQDGLKADCPHWPADAPAEIYLLLAPTSVASVTSPACGAIPTAVVAATARPARVVQADLALSHALVATVDADGIAEEAGADPLIPVLAAAVRLLAPLEADAMRAAIWSAYDRHHPYAARTALQAFDMALSQAQCAPGAVFSL